MKYSKKIIIPAILTTMLFTSCGSADKSMSDGAFVNNVKGESFTASSDNSLNYSPAESNESYDGDGEDISDKTLNTKENNTSDELLKKEMLVYTCNMTIDVKEFDKALNAFKDSLEIYGAFVEKENYSDGGSNSRWQDDAEVKWQSYTATVRVPSTNYSAFCDNASDLGYLRSKNANVDNLSAEYYDLSTTLEIYEAKEKRYLDLLKDIKDEQYAISIERELTDIQIDISKLKTRMKAIRTDVAYSYVYVTINEVREYRAEPVKTDTFMQRLENTVKNATEGFLTFMEKVLFAAIYVLPYALILAIVIFCIVKFCNLLDKRRAAKKAKAQAAAAVVNTPAEESKDDV